VGLTPIEDASLIHNNYGFYQAAFLVFLCFDTAWVVDGGLRDAGRFKGWLLGN
jgi:hypothetical protein